VHELEEFPLQSQDDLLGFFRSVVGIVKVLLDTGHESSGSSSSGLLVLLFVSRSTSRDTSLVLKSKISLGLVVSVSLLFHSSNGGSIRVKGILSDVVSQGVLLLDGVKSSVLSLVSDGRLDGIGVDDLGNIGVSQDSSVEMISALFLASNSVASEDLIKRSESRFSPDDESTEVTTGGELSEVKSVDVGDFNTGDVSDGSGEGGVFIVVDEKGTSSEIVSSVSELTLTSSEGLGVGNSFNIFVSTESLQEGNNVSGLFNNFELIIDNQRKVGDVVDSVTSGENEGSDGGGSQSGGNGVSLLLDVNLSVPSSPGLQGSEHSTLSTRVGEGTLSSSGSTRTTDSGNSGNGSTGTPGDSGVLHTGMDVNSVSLSGVLGDLVVDELDDIESDGGSADSGKGDLSGDFLGISRAENADGGSSEHSEILII
jgi:hypothetical protein